MDLCQTQHSANTCFDIPPGLWRERAYTVLQSRLMKRTQRFTFGITHGAEAGLFRMVRQ